MAGDPMIELLCERCINFENDPAAIEALLPGLTILSSAYSSVRGRAGICRALGRFMEPLATGDCSHFQRRQKRCQD